VLKQPLILGIWKKIDEKFSRIFVSGAKKL